MKIEAEHRLILSLLSGPEDALPEIADFLQPSDFAQGEYGHIFGAARGLWIEKAPVNEITIAERLGMSVAKLTGLTRSPDDWEAPSRAKHYARIVHDAAFNRGFTAAAGELQKLNGTHSPEQKLGELDALSSALHDKLGSKETADSKSCIAKVRQAMRNYRKPGSVVATGLDCLDQAVPCGLQPGHLWILGGYTSTGKTTIAAQLAAEALKRDKGVVFFTLEMTQEEIARRILAYEIDAGSNKLLMGLVDESGLEKTMEEYEDRPLWIYESVFSLPAMISRVKKCQHEHPVTLVVIDYVQLVKAKGSLFDRMSYVAAGLKEQAKSLGVTILALSQVNHQSQREPSSGLIEFKGGGDLAASAEVALMLVTGKDRNIDLLVRKNKHGRCGQKKLRFRENYSGVEEMKYALP